MKPIILFAFANDPKEFLPELKSERQKIEDIFQGNQQFEIKVLPDASAKDIVEVFLHDYFHGRILGFHYGGHADEGAVMLKADLNPKNVEVSAKSLAAFLGEQPNLKFVFLNGCATGPQVDALFEAGIPEVIATERKINDGTAMMLSSAFYRQLIKPEASVTKAFRMAQSAVEVMSDKKATKPQSWTRGLKWNEMRTPEAGFPWKHFHKTEEAPESPFLELETEPEKPILDQIRDWLENGEFSKALEALKTYTQNGSSNEQNTAIMLSAQVKDYEREMMQGILRDPEIRKARLRYQLLSFLDSLS